MDGEPVTDNETLRAEIGALRHSEREQRAALLAARDRALEIAKRADALARENEALKAELSALRDRERRSGILARLRRPRSPRA